MGRGKRCVRGRQGDAGVNTNSGGKLEAAEVKGSVTMGGACRAAAGSCTEHPGEG